MAPPAHTYIYNIQSVHQANPGVPEILNPVGVDLNRQIAVGDPILPGDLTHARAVVRALKADQEFDNGNHWITDALIENAEMRVGAIEAARCAAVYSPNLVQWVGIIGNNFQAIQDQLVAVATNTRVSAYNARRVPIRPLHKTIPGHGYPLAQAAAQYLDPAILLGVVVPPVSPPIGTAPPNFNPTIQNYEDQEILKMIVFYNNDFGILPVDASEARREKFFDFLCGM